MKSRWAPAPTDLGPRHVYDVAQWNDLVLFKGTDHLEPPSSANLGREVPVLTFLFISFCLSAGLAAEVPGFGVLSAGFPRKKRKTMRKNDGKNETE